MEEIISHFPNLSDNQKRQFKALAPLYKEWNEKINVISRKDMDNFYERHVLHSLGIAKIATFEKGTTILDVGTGGGFPGIPLAILFPESDFHLVDSIGKKIKVVQEVSAALNLKNVRATHARAEDIKEKYDFVVSRAVTRLNRFYPWVRNKFNKEQNHRLRNGILYLKGGDLKEELEESKLKKIKTHPLSKYFKGEFFDTKKVVYVPYQ